MSYQISISNSIKEQLDKHKGDNSYSEVIEALLSPRKIKWTAKNGHTGEIDEVRLMFFSEVKDKDDNSLGMWTLREFLEEAGVKFDVIKS
ncbi:MAG: antitoxin VapB family protein [Ignavibacteria bacterium]|nr:antitoxin VapB family protein [Ignavibacteria bacterium]